MMRIQFHPAGHVVGLPGLLANAEIVFDDGGPLAGLILKGFTVWKSKKREGELTVTFPSRQYKGKEYWLLRSRDKDDEAAIYRFRKLVLNEYEEWMKTRV